MNSLSVQSATDTPIVVPQPISSIGAGKEIEHGEKSLGESIKDSEQSKESELPKEVSAVGVRIQPTTIVMPTVVSHAGVKVINPLSQPVTLSPTLVLPLTDEQIAKGLHESVMSSVRWLAQWCERRLKQVHAAVKDVSGTFVKL